MQWGDVLVHWAHLMAAILWVGSTLAVSLVVQPVLRRRLEEPGRAEVFAELGRRLALLQWTTWGALLATGLLKLWGLRATPGVFRGPFGVILGVKLALVAAMVELSLLHALSWGPALARGGLDPQARAALARRAAFWGKVNAAVMLGIVLCAALLRFNPF